jgi:hypothetical protein
VEACQEEYVGTPIFVTSDPHHGLVESYPSYYTAQGKRALLLMWDNASWHVSQTVQAWITAHNRDAKHEGGCRVIVCRLLGKRPWLNPLEPKWVHGKRAVVEPARVLSMTELIQRVCAYYQCELTDTIAQPDC